MPPRGFTVPAPKTESAREARKSFFCELCQKGYSRQNEFDAHESSYDHQHKKRLKDMKAMQKDPMASTKARKAERRADEKSGLITIKPVKLEAPVAGSGGGFKKGGFKSAFTSVTGDDEPPPPQATNVTVSKDVSVETREEELESETDDEYEMYDPRYPTD